VLEPGHHPSHPTAPVAGPIHADSLADAATESARFGRVWGGVVHEFRNHLSVLLAVTTEVRTALPTELATRLGGALADSDRNVQGMAALLTLVDASVRDGAPLVAELDGILERARRMAEPVLGRRVALGLLPRRLGVKNRGASLECLLAALIIDLGRTADERDLAQARPTRIEVEVGVDRGGLTIELHSSGARPCPGSWRQLLASDLGARLEATVAAHPDVPGYLVQFR
jgi:hypothetical protein